MPAALARPTLAAPVLAIAHPLHMVLVLMHPARALPAQRVALHAPVAPASRAPLTVLHGQPVLHQRVVVTAKA